MSPHILHEATNLIEADACARVVQLSATYGARETRQMTARLASYRVQFVRLDARQKPRALTLNPEEADAFAVTWQAYRLVLAEAQAAERARQDEAKAEAFAIAAEIQPEIEISDGADGATWFVAIPQLRFRRDFLVSGTELLTAVQAARLAWAKHIRALAERERAGYSLRWNDTEIAAARETLARYRSLIPVAESAPADDHPF